MSKKRLRGGSWLSNSSFTCVGFRGSNATYYQNYNLGFRVLRPALKLQERVLRGGSWLDYWVKRATSRFNDRPHGQYSNPGFRVLR